MLGLDQLRTREVKNTHALVMKHIAAVRKIQTLAQATIVFCLEFVAGSEHVTVATRSRRGCGTYGWLPRPGGRSNLAFEAQHILHACEQQGLKRWVALQEGAGNSLGWLTAHAQLKH